jgi:hypothetical protein
MARGLILMRFNGASIYPSVMLERQDGALTSIGARIGILNEQHSTLQLKRRRTRMLFTLPKR